ncbi:hypothetical protein JB92DRAFT_3083494 [Gautieria morchelliformis]|nr:hypothetical protein JB92DRAFT_3083494 [Gautieria morchelliformis]
MVPTNRPPAPGSPTHVEVFPAPAGEAHSHGTTCFDLLHETRRNLGRSLYEPFADQEEWELAQTLMTSGMSFTNMDKLLKLPIVDTLPPGGPEFLCESITMHGDVKDANGEYMVEELELFYRDPVECIRELMGNLAFREVLHYVPEHIFKDEKRTEHIYNEMWTADWWWDLQSKLPFGATICPVILASDKTRLSQFSGDKAAWRVYLTIGNIPKATRRKMSAHVNILLGYLPISKLKCFSAGTRMLATQGYGREGSAQGWQLFHYCMRLSRMVNASASGVDVLCADGGIRKVFPVLAAYALVACVKENWCPICKCYPEDYGDPLATIFADDPGTLFRCPVDHIQHIDTDGAEGARPCDDVGIREVRQPFWENHPHCDIFRCLTPGILHQLHKGVLKDHLSTHPETDARFQAVPSHPSIHHFKKGISTISQWSGMEYKNMEKVFVGLMAGALPPHALKAARAVLDFVYLAQYPSHTTTTLNCLQDALDRFHRYKGVFVDSKIREHFQIPKLHMIEHYTVSIISRGTADGFNTELPERLHIDFSKDFIIQMTQWLTRQEQLHSFGSFLSSLFIYA